MVALPEYLLYYFSKAKLLYLKYENKKKMYRRYFHVAIYDIKSNILLFVNNWSYQH